MIKKNVSIKVGIKVTLTILLATVVSIKYLDAEIAVRVMHFLRTIHTLNKVAENIPKLLPNFSGIIGISTVLMWAIHFYRLLRKKSHVKTKFLKLAATVLPIAYLVKTLLQFVFGRTSPRSWLIHNEQLTFRWLKIWDSSFHQVTWSSLLLLDLSF